MALTTKEKAFIRKWYPSKSCAWIGEHLNIHQQSASNFARNEGLQKMDMRYMTNSEIADALGISELAVANILHKAIKKLREILLPQEELFMDYLNELEANHSDLAYTA